MEVSGQLHAPASLPPGAHWIGDGTAAAFRPALGPTQVPIKWVLGALSPGIKRSEHEAEHSYVYLRG